MLKMMFICAGDEDLDIYEDADDVYRRLNDVNFRIPAKSG